MRTAKDIETFLADPVGCHVGGPGWLVFRTEAVGGMVVWESPRADDAAQVVRTLPASLQGAPHAYFIDARRLSESLDPAAFSVVLEQAGPILPQYQGQVRRCAVVLPAGMSAAVITGFFH